MSAIIALAAVTGVTTVGAEPSGDLAPLHMAFHPGPWAPRVFAQAASQTTDDADEFQAEYDP